MYRGEFAGQVVAVKVAQQFAMPTLYGLVDAESTQSFMEGAQGRELIRELEMHRRAQAETPCQHLIRLEAVVADALYDVVVPMYVLLEWAPHGTVAARAASAPEPCFIFAAKCARHAAKGPGPLTQPCAALDPPRRQSRQLIDWFKR